MSKQIKQTLDDLNRIKFSKDFNGAMAVDVDKENNLVTIGFVSTMGVTISRTITEPTADAVANALVEVTETAHEEAKNNLKAEGANLILKALVSEAFRTPLAANLTNSSRDVKVAKEIKAGLEAAKAQKAEQIALLKAELENLEG